MNSLSSISRPNSFNFADIALSLPIESLNEALKQNFEFVHQKGYGGQTVLHKAVLIGNSAVATLLLSHGADPNFTTDSGDSSIHIACLRGSLKILHELLRFGGDLNLPNKCGSLPVHCAAQSGSLVVIQYLTEVHGCDLELTDNRRRTVLHEACSGGHIELVRFLLRDKKLLSQHADIDGNTILHCAAQSGLSGVCWSVINCGGESLLAVENAEGATPEQLANMSGKVSKDCKSWMRNWTREYKRRRKCLSSPKRIWLGYLVAPSIILHVLLFLPYVFALDTRPVAVVIIVFAFFGLKCIPHRINHPARWANPAFVGLYAGGLCSTILCYSRYLHSQSSIPLPIGYAVFCSFLILSYLLFCLLKNDPGSVPRTLYPKETLISLAEDRLEGRYCPQCFTNSPKNSHHCRLCENCVVQLDHHCLFLNICIALNNHWLFVVFVLLNVLSMAAFVVTVVVFVPDIRAEDGGTAWVTATFWFLLINDLWAFVIIIVHVLSILWGISLLRYQYHVISTQQTSYYRIKSEAPKIEFSTTQKLKNFFRFLYYKKVKLRQAVDYFET